jgi:hypothetical protein
MQPAATIAVSPGFSRHVRITNRLIHQAPTPALPRSTRGGGNRLAVLGALFVLCLAALIGGCASTNAGLGPSSAIVRLDPWIFDGDDGTAVVTRHYVIYTTISDERWQESFAQLMEGALSQYSQLAPDVSLSQRPLECYVFASRREWATFTTAKTGTDATVYLHITRGGYTVRDWFVAFYIGEAGTFSVAAHEGFHQFAARNFKTRLPPFLEEGIACIFENVQWDQGVPKWNLDANPNRLGSLRMATAAGELIPLKELITLHAGQVVNGPKARISAFYGESWAFAQFLWKADNKKFRPRLQHLLADAAAGKIQGLPSRPIDAVFWNPATAKPLLERYLGMDLATLDGEFQRYLAELPDERNDGG